MTHHRQSGWMAFAAALGALSLGEGAVVHWGLTQLGWPALAWLVTALHAYGLLWLLADALALSLYPSQLDEHHLDLRVGMRWRVKLQRQEILSIEPIQEPGPDDLDLSVMGGPNVRITLAQPVSVRGPLGMRWESRQLALQLDEPERLTSRSAR